MKATVWAALAGLLAGGHIPDLMAESPPGIIWDICRLETAQMPLNAVAGDGSGHIIAAGENGILRYSTDSTTTWQTIEDVTRTSLSSITWTGSDWVAIGRRYSNSLVLTSSNGLDWNKCCVPNSPSIKSVTSGTPGTLAVGSSQGTLFSSDLISWDHSLHGPNLLYGVVWSGSLFVAVGSNGRVTTSPDGIAWTPQVSGTTQTLNGIAWSGSRMVAVGYDYGLGDPLIIRSDNGSDWATVPAATLPDSAYLETITWTGTHFVASGLNGYMLTSPDGEAWSSHQAPGAAFVRALSWCGSHVVGVGSGGLILSAATSAPSIHSDWSIHSDTVSAHFLYDLAEAQVAGDVWVVAVGGFGTVLATDDEGQTGTEPSSGVTASLRGVASTGLTNQRFLAVGNGGTIISSADGLNWSSETSGISNHLEDITWFEPDAPHSPVAIAVGSSGTILTSTNGTSWSGASSGTSKDLLAIGQGTIEEGSPSVSVSRAVAVGRNGKILSSDDGSTWSLQTSGTGMDLEGVTWYPGGFLAVGKDGTVVGSPDGISWLPGNIGSTADLYAVSWTGSQLVATGYQGAIFTSPDGSSWTRRYGPVTKDLYAVAALDSGRLMTVGAYGLVLTSDPTPDFADWIANQNPPSGESDPGDDPNHDGNSNLVAYAHGINAVALPTPGSLSALPRIVDAHPGEPVRIRLRANQIPVPDLVFIIEKSTTLMPGSWTELLRHYPGQECSTGSLDSWVAHTTSFVTLELPETIGERPHYFARLRFELRSPP